MPAQNYLPLLLADPCRSALPSVRVGTISDWSKTGRQYPNPLSVAGDALSDAPAAVKISGRLSDGKLLRMNRLQRHVLVVAVGAVCLVVGAGVNQLLNSGASGGWFMYAPNSDAPFLPSADDGTVVRQAAVWLLVILVWASVAWRLYGKVDAERE